MQASPKAELVFEYFRADDAYTGQATLVDASGASEPVLLCAVARATWVRFVITTIRDQPDVERVTLKVTTPEQRPTVYQFAQQTLARIRDASWPTDVFIL